jgi:hypothetical protein
MKTQNENTLVNLNNTEIKDLTSIVEETLAVKVETMPIAKKLFTAVDLWKIQRYSRTSLLKPILVY